MGCPTPPLLGNHLPARIPSTRNSRVFPYSFWAVTSLRTAPLRFHSPYSAMADQIPRRDHLENQRHWSTVADGPMYGRRVRRARSVPWRSAGLSLYPLIHFRLTRPVGGCSPRLKICRHGEQPQLGGFEVSRTSHASEADRGCSCSLSRLVGSKGSLDLFVFYLKKISIFSKSKVTA
jgi:hypothetical protein